MSASKAQSPEQERRLLAELLASTDGAAVKVRRTRLLVTLAARGLSNAEIEERVTKALRGVPGFETCKAEVVL